ncbi:MAG: hypothetical protein M1829_000144 [Trizodia sp. TS-e1964]|nr:MAG: hypothetical protein M1829_000144 [Trizodia sp. TS-e1964]
MAALGTKEKLALAIIDFLSTSLTDGTLTPDDSESIEIAQSCIAECFKVDPSDKSTMKEALGPQSLVNIYGVYDKMRAKAAPSAGPKSAAPETKVSAAPTADQQQKAEALKAEGNAAMTKKDYPAAIDLYTKAIELAPNNAVYLSNRAAAYSGFLKHDKAKADAEAAVAIDPKYTKAWSRLGLAKWALGDTQGSMEAYQKGIDYEGNGGSEAMKKGYETAKRKLNSDAAMPDLEDDVAAPRGAPGAGAGGMPDLSSLAGMFGGAGGPDLASLMNNPMLSSMAQNIMSNPSMLNNLMANPRVKEMAESLGAGGAGGDGAGRGRGGGMPDLSSLMQDPNIAEMCV